MEREEVGSEGSARRQGLVPAEEEVDEGRRREIDVWGGN